MFVPSETNSSHLQLEGNRKYNYKETEVAFEYDLSYLDNGLPARIFSRNSRKITTTHSPRKKEKHKR